MFSIQQQQSLKSRVKLRDREDKLPTKATGDQQLLKMGKTREVYQKGKLLLKMEILKMLHSNFTFKVVVANQGEVMEADTISKNGQSLKSHTSKGNNKYFTLIILGALIFMLSSCTARIMDFTVMSSKNHSFAFDKTQGKQVAGKSFNIKDAMDKALESAGPEYDLLIDGVIRSGFGGFTVTGIAINSRKALAVLGEEGFNNWLVENNVFNPEIAVVQN